VAVTDESLFGAEATLEKTDCSRGCDLEAAREARASSIR